MTEEQRVAYWISKYGEYDDEGYWLRSGSHVSSKAVASYEYKVLRDKRNAGQDKIRVYALNKDGQREVALEIHR